MIPPSSDIAELRRLLDALCDETITPQQMHRLEQLVLQNPEAEAFYVQYMNLHADMIAHFGALASSKCQSLRDRVEADVRAAGVDQVVTTKGNAGFRRQLFWRGMALAVVIAAGLLLTVIFVGPPSSPTLHEPLVTVSQAEVLDDSVAVLLQTTGAVWEAGDLPTTVGSPLPPGWLRLKAGLAHIEFYSGANVILEGPADLQIVSRMKAFCARGRLRATVPPQAQGFEIGSPKLNLIDRGTEFGLVVTENGPTELHVFQGKVEFNEADDANQTSSYTALTTGQSVRLDGRGQISPIKPDSMAFHTAQDLIVSSEAEIRRKDQQWSEFCTQLHRDQSLLVHFTFQEQDSWSRTLTNKMQPSDVQDGAIVGCSWGPGRWPGKQCLEFTQVSDRVRFYVPGDFTSLTLMAWVRVDALNNQFNSLVMTDSWDEGEAHWHIGNSGTLELGVQGPQKKSNAHYEALQAITRERMGRWMHLAVVYNGDSGYVAHFVDGQSVAHLPLKFPSVLRIGEAEIGNWNIANHRNSSPVRNFNGCIDELIIFGRGLGEPEIEQIYNAGRPLQN